MKYFRLRYTLDRKVLGHYPQVKEIKHNCHVWDDPNFIQHSHLKKIDFEPIVSNPILYAKSKRTDLIEQLGIGFSHRLVMSSKLRNILRDYEADNFQFFQCPLFHKNIEYRNYWIMNVYETNQDFIDFIKSETQLRVRKPEGGTKNEEVIISSLADFNKTRGFHKKNKSFLSISKIVIKESVEQDFFTLKFVEGGLGYFVSEKLKKIIEENHCTGLEFQPIEISYNEWLQNGEREKIYGKV